MHIQISKNSVFLSALLAVTILFGSFSAVSAQTVVQFNNNLYWNMAPVSDEVKVLQEFLKAEGHYTGAITGKYLTQTYNAVVAFQNANGISPATGYFGPDTRVKANEILGSQTTPPKSVTTTQTPQTTPTASNNVAAVVTTTNAVVAAAATSATTAGNLIQNPSMEVANGTRPDKWSVGKWGTNTATFNYPTAGFDGSKSANVTITALTSGDAKWFFNEVAVTPGGTYTFSEHYKSNVATNVTIQWKKANGTLTYQSLGNPAPAASWTLRTNTFTVPSDAVAMTIFHVLKTVGTLDIDNYKLVSGTTVGTPTTPTVPAGQTPVNATVTAWGNWVSTSAWTTCSANTQSRTEERTRTVINGPVNGGTVPALKETRTATQTCGTVATPTTPTVPTTPTTPTTPTNNSMNYPKKEWGAYVGWQESDLANFESLVGSQAKHRAVFIHWGNEKTFPTYLKSTVKDKGKTLMVFWEATNYNVGSVNQANYSYDAILNGNFDSYIAQFAAEAKAYGGEVILIPFSEMNGDWFPWSITQNGNTAQKHIDAWRKIREAFRGATNVKFGWAPNHVAVPDTAANQFEKFYPGDAYVDYVGLDGFNFNSPWLTFDQLFGKPLARMKVYNKPVYIFSFASASGTQKGAWITDALNVQIPKYPEIKGWIWFNENKERDWRINSDTNALSAFKSALPLTLPL